MSRFEDYIKTIAPNIHIPSYAKRFENIVEVVRCKDCRYWVENEHCLAWEYNYSDADGYCYLGKRREDAKTD